MNKYFNDIDLSKAETTKVDALIKNTVKNSYIGDDCAYLKELGIVVTQDNFVENIRLDSVCYIHGVPIAIVVSAGIIFLALIGLICNNHKEKV